MDNNFDLCADMAKQPHILIAGATGSGKSVLINAFICSLLDRSPDDVRMFLIDPKRVELQDYNALPHCIGYASENCDIIRLLNRCILLMETRYSEMQRLHLKHFPGADVYIIIDEFADLMTTAKRETLPNLCRIAQLGRAARIHLIIATQRPTRDIVNGQIKVNIDSRIALRCPTAQDSRNIINTSGAEKLPRYGEGYYLTPEQYEPQRVKIPSVTEDEIRNCISRYTANRP